MTENPSDEDLSILDNSFNGQWVQESAIEQNQVVQPGKVFLLFWMKELKSRDEKETTLLPKDAVGISYKMADVLGVNIGDTIEWRIYGDRDWNKIKNSSSTELLLAREYQCVEPITKAITRPLSLQHY